MSFLCGTDSLVRDTQHFLKLRGPAIVIVPEGNYATHTVGGEPFKYKSLHTYSRFAVAWITLHTYAVKTAGGMVQRTEVGRFLNAPSVVVDETMNEYVFLCF